MAKFQHDCDACTFLGTWTGNKTHGDGTVGEEGTWDLYYCGSHTSGSVVCRYGDEGWQYASGPVSGNALYMIDLYPYKECYDRAVEKGLFCNDISNAYMPDHQVRQVVVACDMLTTALVKLEFLSSGQHDMVLREFSRFENEEDEEELRSVFASLRRYVLRLRGDNTV